MAVTADPPSRPRPCTRPAERPGVSWSWTCSRPVAGPVPRGWGVDDPMFDQVLQHRPNITQEHLHITRVIFIQE